MELISMNCPNCSGNIKYKPGKTQMVCPYCDSVIKISMTIEDREFERNISKIANELPKYMASLKKWRIAFFITLPLALLSGVLFFAVDSTLAALPALVLFFGAAPMMNAVSPNVSPVLEKELGKKDIAVSTGKMYGIYIALTLLGFLLADGVIGSKAPEKENDSASTAAAIVCTDEDYSLERKNIWNM